MTAKNPLGSSKGTLNYTGCTAFFPDSGWTFYRNANNPTTSNVKGPSGVPFQLGSLWQNTSNGKLFALTANPGVWTQLGSNVSSTVAVGTGTLTSGTQTVSNTNILTGDLVFLTRISAASSTTLGELTYTISSGASFTVTSKILGTPASTQTADVSTYGYMVIRIS
jgi:hypothetical protein